MGLSPYQYQAAIMPKLNISYPATGAQKLIEVDDEKKWRLLFDKRIANEIEADFLGEQYAGYVFRITGGIDKQGFPMKQGVLVPNRVRLLLDKDSGCYRPKRMENDAAAQSEDASLALTLLLFTLSLSRKES